MEVVDDLRFNSKWTKKMTSLLTSVFSRHTEDDGASGRRRGVRVAFLLL